MPIEDLLNTAQESYVSMASSYQPSDDDKKNLKDFCKIQLEMKELKGGVTASTKPLILDCKSTKQLIKEQMEANQTEIFRVQLENEPTRYVRLCKSTRTLPISFETLREVFNSFKEDELNEEDGGFIECIINKLKLMSKSMSAQIKVSNNLPRGIPYETIPVAPQEMLGVTKNLVDKTEAIKDLRAKSRSTIKEKKGELESVKSNVDEYLQKANVSNQQISYNDTPFTLTKRVTMSKPKLNLTLIEEYLKQCCIDLETSLKKRPKNMNAYFAKNKSQLLEKLEEKLLLLPQEQKSNIYLRKLNEKISEENETEILDEEEVEDEM